MKRARWIPVLIGAVGVLTSCGDGVSPPTTGSIVLLISVEQTQAQLAALNVSRTGQATSGDSSAAATAPELSVAGYTTARATAAGPTNKSIDLTLNNGFWEGELTNLNVGTYTVTVEGLVDGALAAKGVTSGVAVTAGQQATASVTLTSVIPTLTVGIGSPTTSLEIPVSVTTIDGATAYRIQWSTNPDFTGASSKDITGTTGTVSVSNLGTYNIRASAVLSGAAGAPSAAATVDVAGDTPATGDDPTTALALGFGPTSTQQLSALNIAPTGDEDWYQLNACRYDTVIVETFAARLTPASKLNTMLRLFGFDGTALEAENDNLDGTTTDSRIETVLGGEGTYWIQVSGVGGSVGQYEVSVDVRQGVNDDGTQCKPITVAVTPATVTLAPGETQQYSATATDASGNTFTDLKFVWLSADQNVALVDTTGLVTAVGGGTTTITAAGQGEPGYAEVNVTGPALGDPTQLAFSVEPVTTTAGDAFSPAIEVEIRDANGNRVTGARNAVTLAIANNPGSATLSGTKTVNANLGIARFTGLFMDKAATGYTITATSSGLTAATSGGFAITPGLPSQLTFGTQPANVEGNTAFGASVTVTISDQFGNVVPTATNAVTLGFEGNPWRSVFGGGGTLGGTTTQSAVNGVATFNDLTVDKPGPGYSLLGQATDLDSAVSTPFDVGLTVSSVAASGYQGFHTCATAAGGTYCWGYNGSGQLGGATGATNTDSVATLVEGGPFVQVTAGNAHSCGLTSTGAAYCWGDNSSGQLGNGDAPNDSPVPVPVSGGLTFATIAAGAAHTCAVTTTGTAYCWGDNSTGELGDNSGAPQPAPVAVSGSYTFATITAGYLHTCGITTSGDAYCWGWDAYGQLGDDQTLADQPTPVVVAGSLTWGSTPGSISAGAAHTCARTSAGVPYCWGYNSDGQLGLPPLSGTPETESNNTAGTADAASLGAAGTGEINPAGDVDYWVFSATAGTSLNINVDANKVGSPLDPILTLYASDGVTVLAANDDYDGLDSRILYTVGSTGNYYIMVQAYAGGGGAGQTYTVNFRTAADLPYTPQLVGGSLTLSRISAGGFHTCGITSGGTGYCWGRNTEGELGNNQQGTSSQVPVAISGGLSFSSLSAGSQHTCGLVGTEVYCWGLDNAGQLGNGETGTIRAVPVKIVQ